MEQMILITLTLDLLIQAKGTCNTDSSNTIRSQQNNRKEKVC